MKDMIQKMPVIIGVAITAILYIVSLFSVQSLYIPAFLMTGIIVGYMVAGNYKIGAINGLIFGLIGAIIIDLIMVIIMSLQGAGAYLSLLASVLIIYFIIEVIMATIGGILGSYIRAEAEIQREY